MITHNPEETKALARGFLDGLPQNQTGATIVELVGDLGAGKTTFMAGLGETLGVKEPIISPTFLIQRNYELAPGFAWKRLIHIDAYRIEKESELDSIGWKTYASDPHNLICIEWPTNMKIDFQPARRVTFNHISEDEREIKF